MDWKGEQVQSVSGFLRHIDACHSARLPGSRVPFLLESRQVGWLSTAVAEAIRDLPQIRSSGGQLTLGEPSALHGIARRLAEQGLFRWRGEAFDVRGEPGGPSLATIDRGALPAFGIVAEGAHLNGLVRRDDGLHVWVARRAADKALDPSKLDHITAGGVPAGLTPFETLVKEAEEEAGLPPELARLSTEVGCIAYAMDRPEGLRRDRIHCYDVYLPGDFVPQPVDGEVEGFELWPVGRVVEAVRDTDDFKFNVNLVLIDLFLRARLIQGEGAAILRRALDQGEG